MRPRWHPSQRLLLSGAIALGGCAVGTAPPTGSKPAPRSVATSAAPVAGAGGTSRPGAGDAGAASVRTSQLLRVTGTVKLISDVGGGIVSDNGAGVISNNGGSLIGAPRGAFRLAGLAERRLADAEVALTDAAGQPVRGPRGEAITAQTDHVGRFAIEADVPRGNLVLRVGLWNGGELRALVVRGDADAISQDVDTVSSLGAAYVLERLVRGDQALFDKVPQPEAKRLERELSAAHALLVGAPAYDAVALTAAAETLRRQAPGVDQALTAIEAILLGQRNLGDGRPATEVPLNRPYGVALEPDGTLLIAESGLGRIRAVGPDGRIGTRLDGSRGTVKGNLPGVRDLVRAPDGTLYLAAASLDGVHRIGPDGRLEKYTNAALTELDVRSLAARPDGTLLVGGGLRLGEYGRLPRWVAIAPDGTFQEGAPLGPEHGWIMGIALDPDGGHYFLRRSPGAKPGDPFVGALVYLPPGGAPVNVAEDLLLGDGGDLARGPDGVLYVAETREGRVVAIKADGSRTVVAGPETAGGAPFSRPAAVHVALDGTLYVTDLGDGRVHARDAAGRWRVVAGVDGLAAADGATLALNVPASVAFDGAGRLLIAENGRGRITRYADGKVERMAGTTLGFGGDGGPALEARFAGITAARVRGDELLVLDTSNQRLRLIGRDGLVSTVAGWASGGLPPRDPAPFGPDRAVFASCIDLAVGPDGRPYWTDMDRHQVLRLAAPDRVEAVAGVLPPKEPPSLATMLGDALPDGQEAAEAALRVPLGLAFDRQGDLYVADAGHGLIRKITGIASGTPRIETVAGRGPGAFADFLADPQAGVGDGRARDVVLVVPGGLCFDAAGNLYVGELGTRRLDVLQDIVPGGFPADFSALPPVPARVRKIATDGRTTTIAGPGGKFFTDPDAEDALVLPTALAIGPDGRLVIADAGANLVRILPAGAF